MSFVRVATLVLTLVLPAAADIISDITISESDETSALQIKAELFWKPVLNAAEDVKMEKHLGVYADAEAVIKKLPSENEYVRKTLQEALDHLKIADDASFKHALASKRIAKDKMDKPCDAFGEFNFFTAGQNFLRTSLQRFIGGGRYPEKLLKHVEERQADILPVLRGAADVTGDILTNCRLATKKSFDIMKYDIYNKNVPKTPKYAEDIADRIVDASRETRSRFTRGITDVVKGITRDFQEKQEDPAATVTKASVQGLHAKIAMAEAKFSKKSLLSTSQNIDL